MWRTPGKVPPTWPLHRILLLSLRPFHNDTMGWPAIFQSFCIGRCIWMWLESQEAQVPQQNDSITMEFSAWKSQAVTQPNCWRADIQLCSGSSGGKTVTFCYEDEDDSVSIKRLCDVLGDHASVPQRSTMGWAQSCSGDLARWWCLIREDSVETTGQAQEGFCHHPFLLHCWLKQSGSLLNYHFLSVWLPLGGRNAQKEREDKRREQIPWEFSLISAPEKGWGCVGSGHRKKDEWKQGTARREANVGDPSGVLIPLLHCYLPQRQRQPKRWSVRCFLQPLHSSRCFAGASCRWWGPAQLCHRFLPEVALSRDGALLCGRRRCSTASAPSGWVTQNDFLLTAPRHCSTLCMNAGN